MPRRFRAGGRDVYFGTGGHGRRFADRDEALRYLRRLVPDPHDMRTLREWVFREAGVTGGMRLDDRLVLEDLATMLWHGQVSLHERPGTSGSAADPTPAADDDDDTRPRDRPSPPRPVPPPVPPPDQRTWVEIRLVDRDGAPVADARYEVLGSGEAVTASGRLNGDGFVRVEDLEPGSYSVRFPDLDRRAWGPA